MKQLHIKLTDGGPFPAHMGKLYGVYIENWTET